MRIERLALTHVERLAQIQAANFQDLRRVNPMPAGQVTADDCRARLQQVVLDERLDRIPFVILVDDDVAGDISLNHIVRYPLECADVGVFVDRARQARGIGTAALARICDYAFTELELHRLEAGIQPFNKASIRAFEKNGFTHIGLAQQLLFIDGSWRDHILLQKLAPEVA